jgi:hypothetical protein
VGEKAPRALSHAAASIAPLTKVALPWLSAAAAALAAKVAAQPDGGAPLSRRGVVGRQSDRVSDSALQTEQNHRVANPPKRFPRHTTGKGV